jgi:hypothetical protein
MADNNVIAHDLGALLLQAAPLAGIQGPPVVPAAGAPPLVGIQGPPAAPIAGAQQVGVPPAKVPGIPVIPAVHAPLATMPHRNFSSYYNDESKDPLQSRAAAVLRRFAVGPKSPQPEVLLQSILSNTQHPNVFLCCSSLHNIGGPKVYLLHALSRFPPALDGTVTPWDNRIFCYLGELPQDEPITVAIPATAFKLATVARVYDEETLMQELMQTPQGELFPTLGANAGIALQTRYLMYLPSKYAPLLLSSKGYFVKEAYEILRAAFKRMNF